MGRQLARIDDAIRRQREALARKEADALRPAMRAYDKAGAELVDRIDRLTQRIDDLRAAGKPVRIGTIFALEQAQELLRIAEQRYAEMGDALAEGLGQTLPGVVRQGSGDTSALIRDQLPDGALGIDFVDINAAAVEAIVGTTQAGPLREILDSYGAQGAQDLADTLTTGVVMGQGALVIGRRMKNAASISAYRAKMIARTETNRVYRAASQETMRRHADVLDGWQWRSAGLRACAACLVMHGTIHPVNETMHSHPNCRCAPIPVPKSWRDLGFDIDAPYESRLRLKPGPEIFAEASPEQQRRILGPKGYAAYQRGDLALEDFLHETDSNDWGRNRTQSSVRRAEQNHGRTFPYRYARDGGPLPPQAPPPAPGTPPTPPPASGAIRPAFSSTMNDQASTFMAWNDRPVFDQQSNEARAAEKAKIVNELSATLITDQEFMDSFAVMHDGLRPKRQRWARLSEAERRQAIVDHTSDVIGNWAKTSGDADPDAVFAQEMARREFGLPPKTVDHLRKHVYMGVKYQDFRRDVDFVQESIRVHPYGSEVVYRRTLRTMYDHTQARFAREGITEVSLIRGTGLNKEDRQAFLDAGGGRGVSVTSAVQMQPMSSFTSSRKTATQFAGMGGGMPHILRGTVPVSRIIGTARTGYGCWHEEEFVVIGGEDDFLIEGV